MISLKVTPPARVWRFCDWLLKPLMYLLAGTFNESPQETHFWNNQKLTGVHMQDLDDSMMIEVGKDSDATLRRCLYVIPVNHLPLLGGWRQYIVLSAANCAGTYYAGWIAGDGEVGISRLAIKGHVRQLIGNEGVRFFAVNEEGHQIKLQQIGEGRIGSGGKFKDIPLH